MSLSKRISYEEYLNTLAKNDIATFLDTLEVEYNKSADEKDLVSIILEELDDIIYKVLSYYTYEEYQKIKYIIKQNGNIKIRTDISLMKFCDSLVSYHLMYKVADKKYILFKEVYNILKIKIKQKKIIKKCKKNSDEFHLIIGATLAYGAIDLKDFYNIYCEKYDMPERELKEYLISLRKFKKDFRIYEGKFDTYLANNRVNNFKFCRKYAEQKDKAKYSASDLQELYTLKYMKKYKSYRKLKKFIKDSYYIENDSFKVVVECILNPFLEEYQINKQKADKLLGKLFDGYFEFNSKKHKEKFISLAGELAKDYPNWILKGYSEREKEK